MEGCEANLNTKGAKHQVEEMKYRAICLIDTTAKLLERVMNERLLRELAEGKGLHPNQYGFVRGKSTIHATVEVVKVLKEGGGKRG